MRIELNPASEDRLSEPAIRRRACGTTRRSSLSIPSTIAVSPFWRSSPGTTTPNSAPSRSPSGSTCRCSARARSALRAWRMCAGESPPASPGAPTCLTRFFNARSRSSTVPGAGTSGGIRVGRLRRAWVAKPGSSSGRVNSQAPRYVSPAALSSPTSHRRTRKGTTVSSPPPIISSARTELGPRATGESRSTPPADRSTSDTLCPNRSRASRTHCRSCCRCRRWARRSRPVLRSASLGGDASVTACGP